jgi:protein phosphatase
VTIASAVSTKRGKARDINQDAFGLFPDLRLYVVADGMGGHTGGEIASTLAIKALQQYVQTVKRANLRGGEGIARAAESRMFSDWQLLAAVEYANTQVFAASRRQLGLTRMGTTLTALYFDEQRQLASICHVGDSRVYRIRSGALEQLTEDHSFEGQLLKAGKLDKHSLPAFPYRHRLTQAVGVCQRLEPDVRVEPLKAEDLFLIFTNGAYQELTEETILQAVHEVGANLQQLCDRLVDTANKNGGLDDKTVLAARYDTSSDSAFLEQTLAILQSSSTKNIFPTKEITYELGATVSLHSIDCSSS